MTRPAECPNPAGEKFFHRRDAVRPPCRAKFSLAIKIELSEIPCLRKRFFAKTGVSFAAFFPPGQSARIALGK